MTEGVSSCLREKLVMVWRGLRRVAGLRALVESNDASSRPGFWTREVRCRGIRRRFVMVN